MLNYFFGSKTLVTEKTLERNNITLINIKDIKINKTQLIALTASGKFYNATYKNEAVSVKIVDISKDESIINEFIYWQEFKTKECFLKFYGACISGSEAYLVFEFFAFTLENALKNKIIKNDNLPKIAKQILNIVEITQKQKKMIKDLRPGVLGIAEGFKVKLLDFGFLISERPNNYELIEKERNKYRPYESFIYLTEELPYDIWSFGCILIDLFCKRDPIYKFNLSEEEVRKMHEIEAFPIVTDEIMGFLREIILKCLERVPDRRIHIEELVESLSIFLQNAIDEKPEGSGYKKNKDQNSDIKNSFLRENMNFYCDAERKFLKMTNKINDDINDKNILMKNNVEAIHDECITKISENYTQIKQIISEAVTYKIEASDKIDEKIRERILNFQQKTATLLYEICENTNIINEMKSSIINLNSMSNPESFTKLIESINSNRKNIENFIKSYSSEEDFDEIDNNYKENLELIEDYRELSENYELLLLDILEVLKKHNEKFCKNSNIKRIAKKLDITFQMHDNVSESEDLLDFYAKMQEDSHILVIFNFKTKKFVQIKTDFFCPSKSCSYFIKSTNENNLYKFSVYITGGYVKNTGYQIDLLSGGLKIDQIKKLKFISLKEFYEIKIVYDGVEDKYSYSLSKLQDMNHGRNSHSVIMHKEFFMAISGQNTKTCEIYSEKAKQWRLLPEIPTLCLNSSLAIVNNCLYCISGSSTVNSFDAIYKLALNNIEKYFSEEKGFENFLEWEQIEYHFSSKNFHLRKSLPRLRRGMATLFLGGNSIYLFGGFDNDNIYDDIFEVILNPKEEKKLNEGNNNNNINAQNSENSNSTANTKSKIKGTAQNNSNFFSSANVNENHPNNKKDDFNRNVNAKNKSASAKNVNANIFDKSEKAIQEDIINNQITYTYANNKEEERENGSYNGNSSISDFDNNQNDDDDDVFKPIQESEENYNGLKIEKKLTTLPNKTFFSSNPLVIGNTILMVDGFNNAIEYDIVNNHFYYYT